MILSQQKFLSQNFLQDQSLIRNLVRNSSITNLDIVIEIGPGAGIITNELLSVANKVIAIELDPQLFANLKAKFLNKPNLEIHLGNFLDFPLPNKPYKVFSNIPFRLTGDIIRKLLRDKNPPTESYLIVQKEAAEKFAGNSLAAILCQPWFQFDITHQFRRSDFSPTPVVDIVLLHITKRTPPLIEDKDRATFEDFITYAFNRKKPYAVKPPTNPTILTLNQWLGLFRQFIRQNNPAKLKLINGSAKKLLLEQEKLQKIHRTRTDKDWRKFR